MFGIPPALRTRPGVVGRQGQVDPAEGVELGPEVAGPTLQVLQRVPGVDAQPPGRPGHQLREAEGAGVGDHAR